MVPSGLYYQHQLRRRIEQQQLKLLIKDQEDEYLKGCNQFWQRHYGLSKRIESGDYSSDEEATVQTSTCSLESIESALNDSEKTLCVASSSNSLCTDVTAKSVRFGSVSVREYAVVIGNHPMCREGLALSLGWQHTPTQSYSLEEYSSRILVKHRARRRFGHMYMYLSGKSRELEDSGYEYDEDDYSDLYRPSEAYRLDYRERLELLMNMSNYKLSEQELRRIESEQSLTQSNSILKKRPTGALRRRYRKTGRFRSNL